LIIIPRLKLGYQNIPKVATTSMVYWLYDCCEGSRAQPKELTDIPDWKRRYFLSGRFGPFSVENRTAAIAPYEDYYRFAVTRDPVDRFLSMFRNRVVFHRELSPDSKSSNALREAGLAFNPDVNQLIEKLHQYLACSDTVSHHARPMMDFIGPDLSVYSRIADISETNEIVGEIQAYWKVAGVRPEPEGAHCESLRVEQASGAKNVGLHALNDDSFEILLEYYRRDYESLPTVDVDSTKRRYLQAKTKHAAGQNA
jgi:hypothetical protein